jgi:hypothetical protein
MFCLRSNQFPNPEKNKNLVVEGGGTCEQDDEPRSLLVGAWLLATGWRRHGIVDPREVPGGHG